MKNSFKTPIVILANGSFPSHDEPLNFLLSAGTLICTDGSANNLRDLQLEPHIIIGDLDSIQDQNTFKGLVIHDTNQHNTDLEKAIEWAIMNSIEKLIIIGSTGLREDMTYSNISMLYNFFKKIDLKIISDQFTIECIAGENVFNSFKGQRVSLFTQNTNCIITTKKLKYSINGQIEPSLNLISNESVDDQFIISCSRPIILFRGHKEK